MKSKQCCFRFVFWAFSNRSSKVLESRAFVINNTRLVIHKRCCVRCKWSSRYAEAYYRTSSTCRVVKTLTPRFTKCYNSSFIVPHPILPLFTKIHLSKNYLMKCCSFNSRICYIFIYLSIEFRQILFCRKRPSSRANPRRQTSCLESHFAIRIVSWGSCL